MNTEVIDAIRMYKEDGAPIEDAFAAIIKAGFTLRDSNRDDVWAADVTSERFSTPSRSLRSLTFYSNSQLKRLKRFEK